MYRRKQYGQSRVEKCPFCGKQATVQNSQGIPVCLKHQNKNLDSLKCVCGEWLELKSGKWGPYFHCMNCGNINFRKGLEMTPDLEKEEPTEKKKEPSPEPEKERKETVVTSDELDFLY